MAIEILDEFVEIKYKEKVCNIRIPTMEESDDYADNYEAAKSREDKKKVLKDYLVGLGMDEEIYSKMRDSHLRQLIEEFSEKKN